MNKSERQIAARRHAEISKSLKALEAEKKEIDQKLVASIRRLSVSKEVYDDGTTCTLVERTNTGLNKAKLAGLLGMDLDKLEALMDASRDATSTSEYCLCK